MNLRNSKLCWIPVKLQAAQLHGLGTVCFVDVEQRCKQPRLHRIATLSKRPIPKATSITVERFRGRRDARRLSSRGLSELGPRARDSEGALIGAYQRYTHTISTPVMALSLELAGTLDALCRLLQARFVADLGSGFSSYVLRRYASEAGAAVVSVDADSEWLARTREFLELEGLSTDELMRWEELAISQYRQFDFVLDDLGDLRRRIDTISDVLDLVRPGGFVVFDDFHKPKVRSAVLQACRAGGHEALSLRAMTLDDFGRYGCLVRCRG